MNIFLHCLVCQMTFLYCMFVNAMCYVTNAVLLKFVNATCMCYMTNAIILKFVHCISDISDIGP